MGVDEEEGEGSGRKEEDGRDKRWRIPDEFKRIGSTRMNEERLQYCYYYSMRMFIGREMKECCGLAMVVGGASWRVIAWNPKA